MIAVNDPNFVTAHDLAGLLLLDAVRPVAWAYPVAGSRDFRASGGESLVEGRTYRALQIPADLVAQLRAAWPDGGQLTCRIETVGPGGRGVWLTAGRREGIHPGDAWWQRLPDQPAARFDVRYVAADLCYAEVTPLVTDLALRAGERVLLWPSPREQADGAASSAVSFVEAGDRERVVWVAAVPQVDAPSELHIDYFHAGRYIGHGLVERSDERFWYATFVPLAARPSAPATAPAGAASGRGTQTTTAPAPEPTTRTLLPDSRPVAAASSGEGAGPVVGDTAIVRTRADIRARRFIGRIFELTPAGALLNAGEAAGVEAGQDGTVRRAGETVGRVTVNQAQPTYSVVRAAAEGDQPAPELLPGDEVCFAPPPPPPVVCGVIQEVLGAGAEPTNAGPPRLVVRVGDPAPPLGAPLAIRAQGQARAVAVLVAVDSGLAGGFVIPASLLAPLAPGMELVRPGYAAQPAPTQPAASGILPAAPLPP